MSVLSAVLDAVVTLEAAAALKIGGHELRVVKRKLPKREDAVDTPQPAPFGSWKPQMYQVTVSGAEVPERCARIAFGGVWRVAYAVEVTLILPNDRDQLTNLDAVTDWREAVRARYMTPAPPTALATIGVKRVEIEPGTLFDRKLLADGYDYDQVVLSVLTYERRA